MLSQELVVFVITGEWTLRVKKHLLQPKMTHQTYSLRATQQAPATQINTPTNCSDEII